MRAIEDEFDIDKEAINEFTGYYNGAFVQYTTC